MGSRFLGRRDFLRRAMATTGAVLSRGVLAGGATATADPAPGRLAFGILHTNDLHSSFLGVGPVTDYRPELAGSADGTLGGYARLASLIRERRDALAVHGPVLVLDAGDFSMGTALGAATRATGAELQMMARMGYDATTFGDHEFDFGPEGLGQLVRLGMDQGTVPPIVASNLRLEARNESLGELRRLTNERIIRPYLVINRGGIRFGVFGVIGYDAQKYLVNPGHARFDDPIERAKTIARQLREVERVDAVICLSHGGLRVDAAGVLGGEDLRLGEAVPGIDVVVGGHTHTLLTDPLTTSQGAIVVQAHCHGQRLGELVVEIGRGARRVQWFRPRRIDATLPGDPAIIKAIDALTTKANRRVFAAYGYEVLQPLVTVTADLPASVFDLAASTPLGNLVTDAIREATGADVGFTLNGALPTGLSKGKTGRQTVYDVFQITPFGFGIVDPTAGAPLVTAYFTGRELKSLFEFFLADDQPTPGAYFPRVSGIRVHYSQSRPRYDRVTTIERGSAGSGYRPIDTTGTEAPLFSVSSNLYVALIMAAVPKLARGQLHVVPKNVLGTALDTRLETLDDPRTSSGPYLSPPRGQLDPAALDNPALRNEVKEWQALMEYLRRLLDQDPSGLPLLRVDARLAEVRVIRGA